MAVNSQPSFAFDGRSYAVRFLSGHKPTRDCWYITHIKVQGVAWDVCIMTNKDARWRRNFVGFVFLLLPWANQKGFCIIAAPRRNHKQKQTMISHFFLSWLHPFMFLFIALLFINCCCRRQCRTTSRLKATTSLGRPTQQLPHISISLLYLA